MFSVLIAVLSLLIEGSGEDAEALAAENGGELITSLRNNYGNLLLDINYKNQSQTSHCIRSIDFSPILYDDALSIVLAKSKQAKFRGGGELLSDRVTKYQFLIIPPGGSISETVDLREYYSFNSKDLLSVSYGVAVMPCSLFDNGYVQMPSPGIIKYTIDKVGADEAKILKDLEYVFEDWSKEGFVKSSSAAWGF